MDSLPIFLRLAGQPVLLIGDGPAADAKARLIEAAGGRIVRDVASGARLAFVALDDGDAAASEAARLKTAGLLVNVVDRPALCDFTVPAIVDRSPVIVAVGTGGASASLAKALRQSFEALLPERIGDLAKALFAARGAIAARHETPAARRIFLDGALVEGGPLDPLRDHPDHDAAVARAVADDTDAPTGMVTIVLRSDDPDDLTLREARWLARADCIRHGPEIPAAVLDRARRDATRQALEAPFPATGSTVTILAA